ncbi:MAG: hypothetical protein PGN20_15075 [Agrobacterium cavarae]
MTALSGDRNTPERSGSYRTVPVAAGVILYAGSQAAINAAGFAVPDVVGPEPEGCRPRRAACRQQRRRGRAKTVQLYAGIFRFDNSSAGDAITRADITSDCYGVDDQTVAKTSASQHPGRSLEKYSTWMPMASGSSSTEGDPWNSTHKH